MPTQTPNYNFDKPIEGGDDDTWGGFLNGNWDSIDTLLKALTDRVTAAEEALKIPVGGLYFSGTDTDPATTLGYGTWVQFAAGKAIVGVGTEDSVTWDVFDTKGTATETLTEAQMPTHAHNVAERTGLGTSFAGGHFHPTGPNGGNYLIAQSTSGGPGIQTGSGFGQTDQIASTGTVADHQHLVDVPAANTSGVGGSEAHNNIQPSVAVYIYYRQA